MRRHAIGSVALFALGFCIASVGLNRVKSLPDVIHLRSKFEHFSKHANDYDVVVVGSSRILRGFDPATFDTRTRELGAATHSFNFGIPGMCGHEADRLIDDILALHPAKLQHLIVEFPDFRPSFLESGWANSARAVWWHDPATTLDVLESVRRSDDSTIEKCDLALLHVRLMLEEFTNYGAVDSVCERLFAGDPAEERLAAKLLAREGFGARPDATGPSNDNERKYFDPHSRIQEEFAPRVQRRNERDGDLDSYNTPLLLRQIERVANANIALHYVTVPCSEATPLAYRCADRGMLPSFLSMNDPSRYPSLWKTSFFNDGTHLKESGAREFSRLLAEAFVAKRSD